MDVKRCFKILEIKETDSLNQNKEPLGKKQKPDRGVRKKKRKGFQWILMCMAVCIGFYMVAPHVKTVLSAFMNDKSEEKRDVQSLDDYLGKDRTIEIQRFLNQLAYDPGPLDGVLGNQTVNAINQFKTDYSIQTRGTDSHKLINALERHAGIAQLTIQIRHDGRPYYVKLIREEDHSEVKPFSIQWTRFLISNFKETRLRDTA